MSRVNRLELGPGFFVTSAGDSSEEGRARIRTQVKQVAKEARMNHEQEQINAAHPIHTKRYDLYEKAQRLVGERHSKGDLIELVNWLLSQNDQLHTENERLRTNAAEIWDEGHAISECGWDMRGNKRCKKCLADNPYRSEVA